MCIRDSEDTASLHTACELVNLSSLVNSINIEGRCMTVTAVSNELLSLSTVSYTHLDVYKRQKVGC